MYSVWSMSVRLCLCTAVNYYHYLSYLLLAIDAIQPFFLFDSFLFFLNRRIEHLPRLLFRETLHELISTDIIKRKRDLQIDCHTEILHCLVCPCDDDVCEYD